MVFDTASFLYVSELARGLRQATPSGLTEHRPEQRPVLEQLLLDTPSTRARDALRADRASLRAAFCSGAMVVDTDSSLHRSELIRVFKASDALEADRHTFAQSDVSLLGQGSLARLHSGTAVSATQIRSDSLCTCLPARFHPLTSEDRCLDT